MKLLPRDRLIKTGPVDHAVWNYSPVLGLIQRLRFRIVLALLAKSRRTRILEIGYGSGVFMPELSARCDELYGVDIHSCHEEVAAVLSGYGVRASLFCSGAESLPFEDSRLDCAIAVSALEFVSDLDAVCREVTRVLQPDGAFIVVTPGVSPIIDCGLKLLAGTSAKDDFANRRQAVIPALRRHFHIQRMITAPPLGSSALCLYRGLKCIPK